VAEAGLSSSSLKLLVWSLHPVTVMAERWGEAVTELGLGRRSRQHHLLWLGHGGRRLLLDGGDI